MTALTSRDRAANPATHAGPGGDGTAAMRPHTHSNPAAAYLPTLLPVVGRAGNCAPMLSFLLPVGIGALFSFAAHADTIAIATSSVTLQASERPGAIAEVVFDNNPTNDKGDEGTRRLVGAGIAVTVTFDWDVNMAGADGITILPPEGVTCDPSCNLVVPEFGAPGVVWLFSGLDVGM